MLYSCVVSCRVSRKVVVLEKTEEESFGFEIQVRGPIRSALVEGYLLLS
jgi:hypothetical protein